MRLVLDTNTALSGLIWGGFPGRLIDAAVSGQIQLISSVPLLSELEGVLKRPKFNQPILKRGCSVSVLFDGYAALVDCVVPADLGGPVSRDPEDDAVLAAAIGGRADLIVSGDDDLLCLVEILDVPILSARDAVNRLEGSLGHTCPPSHRRAAPGSRAPRGGWCAGRLGRRRAEGQVAVAGGGGEESFAGAGSGPGTVGKRPRLSPATTKAA